MFVIAAPRPGETWIEADDIPSRVELESKLNTSVAVGGMLIDVWLIVLPLIAVYKLQLRSARKVGLMIMFSTGLMLVFSRDYVLSLI